MLIFDPVPHVYTWDGVPVPGVTSILQSTLGHGFASVPEWRLEYARNRGVAVHKACELDLAGSLDEDSVDPAIAPYLKAWRAFRRLHRPRIIASEMPLYSRINGYAGTADFIFDNGAGFGVVDIKSGASGTRAQLQTAAYAHLVEAKYSLRPMSCTRYALELRANERFEFVPHIHGAQDWRDFLSCLNVHRLKEKETA
jgi:hypothetical protein